MAETTEQYRTRINQLKTGIENEPYIKKMRENIAEGISKTGNRQADIEERQDKLEDDFVAVQQDARSNTPSGAELAVAAGSYNTLGERLDAEQNEVNAQLEHTNRTKADVTYVDQTISRMSGGAIKGTYTTLTALETAYPDGAVGPFMIEETGNRYIWDVNKLDWVDIGPYEPAEIGLGDITTEKIATNAVTTEKTDFINTGENLFNPRNILVGGYYSAGGKFVASTAFDSTGFIRVYPSTNYKTNVGTLGGIYGEIVFFDEAKAFVSSVSAGDWSAVTTITTPTNATYVSLPFRTANTQAVVDGGMFVQGDVLPTEFIPFEQILSSEVKVTNGSLPENLGGVKSKHIAEQAVTPEKTSFLTLGKNIFDSKNIIEGGYFTKYKTWKPSTTYNTTGFIPVKELTEYKTNIGSIGSIYGDVVFYDINTEYVDMLSAGSWNIDSTISTPENVAYISLPFRADSTASVVDTGMIVEGSELPSTFVPFSYTMSSDIETSQESIRPTTYGERGLFFGDSITKTATVSTDGTSYTEGTRSNWPKYASRLLGLSSFKNYAEDGASYKNRNLDNPLQYIGYQIEKAIENNEPADIIVVSAGTNDTSSSGDYDTAMSKATKAELDTSNLYESIRWSFWTLREQYPDATFYAATPIQRANREQDPNLLEAIEKMANRYNFIVIDGHNESGIIRDFEVVGGSGRYLRDGLHPHDIGQELLGKLYARVIKNTYMK